MVLDVYALTDPGGRDHNEDSIAYEIEGGRGMFVVADGLGGHAHGEAASKEAADCFMEAFRRGRGDADPAAWLRDICGLANEGVMKLQEKSAGQMKTTVVALYIEDGEAFWANVGDSRLYYLHEDEIAHVTADHSVSYMKYRAGEISRAQINRDPDQSSLLRALGNNEKHEPDLNSVPGSLSDADGFCLCSDGVWEYCYDEEILIDFLKAGNAREWGELLLSRVLSRVSGGNDNFSILTVIVGH